MTRSNRLAQSLLPLLLAALLVACGGKTVLPGDEPPSADAGVHVDAAVVVDGQTCVDLEVTSANLACDVDQDCVLANTGLICEASCGCPGSTPINSTALARLDSELHEVTFPPVQGCPGGCAVFGTARCLGGQCTLCGFGPEDQPPGCVDAGIPTPVPSPPAEDAGFPVALDGSAGEDAGACVDIDLSTYDQSCTQTSDCFAILAGDVCDGACSCDDAAINKDGYVRYTGAVSGISLMTCRCSPPTVACISGMCATVVGDG